MTMYLLLVNVLGTHLRTVRIVQRVFKHDYSPVWLICCRYCCIFVVSPALPVMSFTSSHALPLTWHERANHDRVCHVSIALLLESFVSFWHQAVNKSWHEMHLWGQVTLFLSNAYMGVKA